LRSKQLKSISYVIFSGKLFDVNDALKFISTAKSLEIIDETYNDTTSPTNYDRKANILTTNISLGLHSLRYYNAVVIELNVAKSTVFSSSNLSHRELLEKLWDLMLPGYQRVKSTSTPTATATPTVTATATPIPTASNKSNDTPQPPHQQQQLNDYISESWKDLGFQGTDPSTDFRGIIHLNQNTNLSRSRYYRIIV